jgi:hypothetical protein
VNAITASAAALLVLGLPVTDAQAQMHFAACTVGEIVLHGENNAHVQLGCPVSPRPPCAIAGTYVAFDKATTEGRQYLAMFTMAQASGALVTGLASSPPP